MAQRDARPQARRKGARRIRLLATFVVAVLVSMTVPPAVVELAERPSILSVEGAPLDGPEFEPLPERSVLVGPDGRHVGHLHGRYNRRVVPLEEVPDHVWQAVLAAEDRRFFEHHGFDAQAITRAAVENLRARRIVQGGSTITQQLAKTFVGDDVTLERKGEELRVAVLLEARYSKIQLLDRYLNQVYFGSGAYGIAAAAEEFFGRSPDELRLEQSALLAALIRAPTDLDPRREPRAAKQRRDAVLALMAEEGHIGAHDAVDARRAPLGVVDADEAAHRHPDVVAAVQREFLDNPAFGDTRALRSRTLLTGGLEITTTIDVELQRQTADLIRRRFPEADGVTAAIVALEPDSGAVRVAVSGRDPHDSQFNPALQARRQPGSAYKTFVLAAALENGYSLDTALEGTTGARFGTPASTGEWATRGIRNFGDRTYGSVTARQALVDSVNTAFADLVVRVGADAVAEVTDRLGISREAYGETVNHAIALGGLHRGVSPLEMASAYGAFANDGVHISPHVIDRVLDADGQVLHRADTQGQRALRPEVNTAVARTLAEVVEEGTGVRAQLPDQQAAGKTGTTQDNQDLWFVGTTSKLSAAVWIGHPDRRQRLAGMSSGGTAAPLWRDFILLEAR